MTTTATATATAATDTLSLVGYCDGCQTESTMQRHAPHCVPGTGTGAAMLANRLGIRIQLAIVKQQSMMRHPSYCS